MKWAIFYNEVRAYFAFISFVLYQPFHFFFIRIPAYSVDQGFKQFCDRLSWIK